MDISRLAFFSDCHDMNLGQLIEYLEAKEYGRHTVEYHIKYSLAHSFERFLVRYFRDRPLTDEQKSELMHLPCMDVFYPLLAKVNEYNISYIPFVLLESMRKWVSLLCFSNEQLDAGENRFYPEEDNLYSKDNNQLHNLVLDLTQHADALQTKSTKEDLEKKSYDNTPLILACKTGHIAWALELVKRHRDLAVDVNAVDSHGMSALHWACFFRDDELISALCESGASSGLKNQDGQTCLDIYRSVLSETMHVRSLYSAGYGSRSLPGVPVIIEASNQFYNPSTLEPYPISMTDILFHMDKIAFHRLGITLEQLEFELKKAKYSPYSYNSSFEVFTYTARGHNLKFSSSK